MDEQQKRDADADAFIEAVNHEVSEHNSADLVGYAVEDAMRGIIENWNFALRCDSEPLTLVNDISEIIERLRSLHAKLETLATQQTQRPSK